jgi:hypothetical protein
MIPIPGLAGVSRELLDGRICWYPIRANPRSYAGAENEDGEESIR